MFRLSSSIILIFAALVATCYSELTITSPNENTLWKVGQYVTVSWNTDTTTNATAHNVELLYGTPESAAIQNFGKVSERSKQFTFALPLSFPGTKYYIKMGDEVSQPFTITLTA
eukprot:TRINITY_DN34_c0_g3_i1.p2 TRINITY_DN34_c0_g3~~TRINITY_DN34_c0_g3_i1.p2  ORF type:complete len:114 (+),score=32.19 TRINITY_DN34_c0_g3_i1:452-793(+)